MATLIIELDDYAAEALEYRANSINGGTVDVLVPNEHGNGYDTVTLNSVKVVTGPTIDTPTE